MNSVSAELRDGVEKLFGFFPSKAWIGNGFTINMITANLLITWFNIAFDHQSLDQLVKLRINNAGFLWQYEPAVHIVCWSWNG